MSVGTTENVTLLAAMMVAEGTGVVSATDAAETVNGSIANAAMIKEIVVRFMRIVYMAPAGRPIS
jgi:hypothetical protein